MPQTHLCSCGVGEVRWLSLHASPSPFSRFFAVTPVNIVPPQEPALSHLCSGICSSILPWATDSQEDSRVPLAGGDCTNPGAAKRSELFLGLPIVQRARRGIPGRSVPKGSCSTTPPPTWGCLSQGSLPGIGSLPGQARSASAFLLAAHGAFPETLHLAAGARTRDPGYRAGGLQPRLRDMQLPPSAPW